MPTPHTPRIAVAIMAAGQGTRLKSKYPKVLHEVGGKPLLAHVIAAATSVVQPQDVYAIIGHQADLVRKAVQGTGVNFVLQEQQRGTGHAIMVCREALSPYEHVIVLSGDAPLIAPETIARLRDFHLQKKAAMTLLSAELANPTGYGRVIRKSAKGDDVKAIVEEKSATPAQKRVREINSGIYAFTIKPLYAKIGSLKTDNAHQEYYLTDMAGVFARAKARVVAIKTANPAEVLGSNTRAEMMEIDARFRMAKSQQLMSAGASIFFPQTCVIDAEVEVGADAVIEPYSHLRPGSDIGEGAQVGNFVETKKIKLGKGSKANHLTYLGDAEIGAGVNVGAGTITCNYDGVNKHTTEIGDGVFVGSDTTLVAPVKVGNGAYIGAASCITEDVPEDALAVGRGRQVVKEGWARSKREQLAAARKR